MNLLRLLLLTTLTVGLFGGRAESCSPPTGSTPELTKAQKAHYADTIVVGKIVQTYNDPALHYGEDFSAYTAAMDVYCIYKGTTTASVINITHVGSIPGLCISTTLNVGSEYVVYLADSLNRINEVQMENTKELRYNMSRACGLKLRYPDGKLPSDIPFKCPEPAMDTECVQKYRDPAIREDHSHEGHEHEKHSHEVHGHKGYDHEEHDHEGHDHEEHDHEEHDHEGHDHEELDHEGTDHDGHNHGGHDAEGHADDHSNPQHNQKVEADGSDTVSHGTSSHHLSYLTAGLLVLAACFTYN